MAGRQLASPIGLLRRHLDDIAQTRRVDREFAHRLAVVPELGGCLACDIDDAVWTDQLEQVVLRILAGRMREFRDEGLDREGMLDIVDRSEPADTRMRLGFPRLDPQVRDIERRVARTEAERE